MSRRDDEELAELLEELEGTLRELRAELGPRSRRTGPRGLPAPPSPRQLFSFASEYAIPTTIAVLEANIKALELLQRLLRVGDPSRSVEDARRTVDGRAARIGRETMAALDGTLADLQRELEEGTLPRSGDARDIVTDARRLNEDVADWIRDAETTADGERERERTRTRSEDEATVVDIDVDSELESIRDELDDEGDDGTDGRGDEDRDGE